MSVLKNYFTPLHKRTSREYLPRMVDDKVHCMLKAKEYEFDYWDGDRRYGYGGYSYDGRWKNLAKKMIQDYGLINDSRILDVGCGKAHLLYEMKQLLPGLTLYGYDISKHGIATAPEDVRKYLTIHRAEEKYEFEDDYFDLVLSIGCLHNLKIFDLKKALGEIERVGKQKYIMMESYRNEQELFNLQCWALTCESFYEESEWIWLFEHFRFSGDYEFIFFE